MDPTDRADADAGPTPGPAAPTEGPGRLSAGSAALVAAFALTALTVNLGRPWALTFHEVNFAEPAREFLRSGDWLVPRIMGKPLWDKPPLMHWAIALTMRALGTEAEWAARLPAGLSAAATALVVAALAARWHGDRAGLIAGLVQSTTVYAFMQGRLAEADMMLCAAVAAAMACFAVASGVGGVPPGPARRRAWAAGYFGAAGLAFLVKGPIGPALVAAGSGLFALVERRRGPWRVLLDPIGWAVMLALLVAWPAAAMWREPGLLDVWWRHNAERFSGRLDGGGKDPFFYLYSAAWLALPWTPMAAWGAASASKAGRRSDRLLACWAAGMAALLTLSAWKHKHYIIPALPPLSIWAAVVLDRLASGRVARPAGRTRRAAWLAGSGVIGLGAAAVLIGSGRETLGAVAVVSGLAALGLGVALAVGARGRRGTALAVVFGAAWVAFVAVQSLAMPGFDAYRGQSDLAQRLGRTLPEGADLSVVAIPDPQVTYYLPIPVHRHDDDRSLADRLARRGRTGGDPVYLVGPIRMLRPIARLGEVRVLDRAASVHPRKGPEDRMVAAVLLPNPSRVAQVAATHALETRGR